MKGWTLTSGDIQNHNPDEEALWKCFGFIFSSKSKKQSTYKYGFLRSIIENLYCADEEHKLSYDQLFMTFTRVYWVLVINHRLSQTDKSHAFSAVEKIMYQIQQKYKIPAGLDFDKLPASVQLELFHNIKKQVKRNVIGALWGDSEGILYSFSHAEEHLQINKNAYVFMQRYQQTLLKLNNYEWAKFLEKNNTVPLGFINAIDMLTKRSNLEYFRKILEEITDYTCFYCGGSIKNASIEVDHVIPWSYIHNDNLWNLVLACRACNNSKRDRLPEKSFINCLIERNENWKQIPDMQIEMKTYHRRNLEELYIYAENNGFLVGWLPGA